MATQGIFNFDFNLESNPAQQSLQQLSNGFGLVESKIGDVNQRLATATDFTSNNILLNTLLKNGYVDLARAAGHTSQQFFAYEESVRNLHIEMGRILINTAGPLLEFFTKLNEQLTEYLRNKENLGDIGTDIKDKVNEVRIPLGDDKNIGLFDSFVLGARLAITQQYTSPKDYNNYDLSGGYNINEVLNALAGSIYSGTSRISSEYIPTSTAYPLSGGTTNVPTATPQPIVNIHIDGDVDTPGTVDKVTSAIRSAFNKGVDVGGFTNFDFNPFD